MKPKYQEFQELSNEYALQIKELKQGRKELAALSALKAGLQSERDNCGHVYMEFGDQTLRRCYKCDELKRTEGR